MLQSVTNGDTMEATKLKRGQKLCKNCNNVNGARAHVCKHCQFEFVKSDGPKSKFKKKKRSKKYLKINWKELVKGDKIKVFKGGGNYYVNEMGEKIYMSRPGIYTIHNIDDHGLIVYSNKNGGFGYIYMDKETESSTINNYYRAPHKIAKLNIPVRENDPNSP
jgi:hypothetical protein